MFDDARDSVAQSAFNGIEGRRVYTGREFEVHESRLLLLRIKERIKNFQNRIAKSDGIMSLLQEGGETVRGRD